MTPMITRDAPRLICASSPNSRTRVMIRWICSSVALGCVITIIFLVRDDQNEVSRNFLQAQIHRRTRGQMFQSMSHLQPSLTRWAAVSDATVARVFDSDGFPEDDNVVHLADIHEPQLVIVTGVPTDTDLKKFSAMNSGIRIQPCDAG